MKEILTHVETKNPKQLHKEERISFNAKLFVELIVLGQGLGVDFTFA